VPILPHGATRPILVTGSHRSGTTWVGRTLVRSRRLGWVAEPFHPRHRRTVFAAEVPRWYTYVCGDNEGPYRQAMADTLAGRYGWSQTAATVRRPLDAALAARDVGRFLTRRALRQRPVLKDPLALFSTPWLADRFGADVILLVRHPAAMAQSLQRLNWRFNLSQLLDQPLLVRDLLGPWEDELRRAVARGRANRDVIDEAALLWKLVYGVAARWRDQGHGWLFMRHEDMSADPAAGFDQIFAHVGLPFTGSIRRYVGRTTGRSNPAAAPQGRTHALARDSRANAWSWRGSLAAGDVERVRRLTAGVVERWYDDADWDTDPEA